MGLRRLARNWDAFAAEDPLWSILTWDDKRDRRWRPEEFFATGQEEIAGVMGVVRELCPALRSERALDFGCGVGRLTQALASEFGEVHGVDVAPRMIEAARRFDSAQRCTFHVNAAPALPRFADGYFDFVYSSITLQHVPPRLIRGYVREFTRVVAPRGCVAFQLPEAPRRAPNPNRVVHAVGVLGSRILRGVRATLSRRPTMDMFGLARDEVRRLLMAGDCEVLEVTPSALAGTDWHSYVYFAQKR